MPRRIYYLPSFLSEQCNLLVADTLRDIDQEKQFRSRRRSAPHEERPGSDDPGLSFSCYRSAPKSLPSLLDRESNRSRLRHASARGVNRDGAGSSLGGRSHLDYHARMSGAWRHNGSRIDLNYDTG